MVIPNSSKVAYRETRPTLRTLSIGRAAEAILIGTFPWGPVASETIAEVKQNFTTVTGWPEVQRIYGGWDADHDAPELAFGFFAAGGQRLHIARVVHFTTPSNPATKTSARATATLKYTSATATYGTVTATETALYELAAGDTLDCKVDGGATDTATFDAAAALLECTTAETYNLSTGGETLTLKMDQGTEQTVTFQTSMFAVPTAATAEEVAAAINAQLLDGKAYTSTSDTKVTLESDTEGTGSYVQVTGGTANTILNFSTSEVQGTGDVSDIRNVTIAEVKALVEADVAGVTVIDNGDDTFSIRTNTSGASGSIQVEASSTADTKFGLDNTIHSGTDTSDVDALTIEGKFDGDRGNDLDYEIAAATSGVGTEYDLIITEDSVFAERFVNLTYATVEGIVNADADGSNLVRTTKLADYNPDVGTGSLTGGDDGLASIDDNDYKGDQTAGNGFYAFDSLNGFRLALCDYETAVTQKALMDYLQTARKYIGVLFMDCPDGNSYAQARSYVTTNGLKGYSELGAIFWPFTEFPNPDKVVFGTDDTVEFRSAGFAAGRMSYVSAQHEVGIFDQPANRGPGEFKGAVGVTDDEVNKEHVRDLLYPDHINPVRSDGGIVFNDGVLNLKQQGANFPSIGERVGACEIAHQILDYLDTVRHLGNSADTRAEIFRNVDQLLRNYTRFGAFASKVPANAYYIDMTGNTPQLERAKRFKMKVGIATKAPMEFIDFELGYDERGLIFEERTAA